MTLAPGMAANERVRELPADMAPMEVMAQLYAFHREEIERSGAAWPAEMTMEKWLTSPTDIHIFPNSVVLPTLDGALWYRMRPRGADHDACIFDIWSFGRFASGQEPRVEQEVYDGFEAFRGQCEFLEEDFANMEAVNQGVKSRGFQGASLNPVQEATVAHFHTMLNRFLTD